MIFAITAATIAPSACSAKNSTPGCGSRGIDLVSGSVGENFTTSGIDLDALKVGDRLRVGECLIEITDVRIPCRQLNDLHPELLKTIHGHSGWVAKVIEEAVVKSGDAVEVLAGQ